VQPWIRIARTVTKQGKVSTPIAQVDNIVATSVKPINNMDINYSGSNTPYQITWGEESLCSLMLWDCARCCLGFDKPWGFNWANWSAKDKGAIILSSSDSQVRAWHFLGDKGSDATKVWQVESEDRLNVFIYEFIDKQAGTATGGQAYQIAEKINWSLRTITI
jgi:hypothetical protein